MDLTVPDLDRHTDLPPGDLIPPDQLCDRLWNKARGDRPDPRTHGNWRPAA